MATWAIGLMSGTSIDGVDAVLAGFGDGDAIDLRATCSRRYPRELRARLLAISTRAEKLTLAEFAALDADVGEAFAQTAVMLLENSAFPPSQIRVIGSHGQTVFHDPTGVGNSLQIGDPNRIAARTGIATVADFRRRDIAEGGQGAPLVPAFHHAVFARADEALCVVNIGGIANVTLLPDADAGHVRGFDTGPGNGLMDEWATRHLGQACDTNGQWARSGQVNAKLLEALLADPWFKQAAPKSTGRGHFNIGWAEQRFPALRSLPPADVQRTFCELTTRSIIAAAQSAQQLLVCGGGARNEFLMQCLGTRFNGATATTGARGLDPQWVEATAFAWLALQRVTGRPGNLPAVTGARRSVILGAIY